MQGLTAAIHARLSGDATLAALLSTYGGAPAVFTADPVPPTAILPFVVTSLNDDERPNDTKNRDGREVRRSVRCYSKATGSVVTVEAIAERVRTLLHRQPLSIAGQNNYLVDCSGTSPASSDPDIYGLMVMVRVQTYSTA